MKMIKIIKNIYLDLLEIKLGGWKETNFPEGFEAFQYFHVYRH